MGLSPFKNCSLDYAAGPAPAPNPDPKRWELLEVHPFRRAYVLVVRYLDCTNFEGVKVMVFRGKYRPGRRKLDPHFSEDAGSPVARFRPDKEGKLLAIRLAESL